MKIGTHFLAAVALSALVTSDAFAGSITINPHGADILYGSSWDGVPPGHLDSVLAGLGYEGDITLTLLNGTPGGMESWYGSGVATVILEEIAGYSNATTFGWYDTSNPTNYGQLFAGSDGVGVTASHLFDPAMEFGFFIDPNGNLDRLHTEHDLNAGNNHQVVIFAIDQFAGQYILGWEDLALSGNTDQDYQDMILRIAITSVPEPAAAMLMLLGVAGLYRRRRLLMRQTKSPSPAA